MGGWFWGLFFVGGVGGLGFGGVGFVLGGVACRGAPLHKWSS